MSRDIDAWITDREYYAVLEWLRSNTLFHIMRDHPLHFFPMLGGTWSFCNKRNRIIGREIFLKITNKSIIRPYNNRLYLEDQFFLIHHVWPLAKLNSTIHDSYFCGEFGDKTLPFPTKRPSLDCFISCNECCIKIVNLTSIPLKLSNKSVSRECPITCRKNKNWKFC
jgi:hypothetical protein